MKGTRLAPSCTGARLSCEHKDRRSRPSGRARESKSWRLARLNISGSAGAVSSNLGGGKFGCSDPFVALLVAAGWRSQGISRRLWGELRESPGTQEAARMVLVSVLHDALKTMYNAEKRGKRQVLLRPSSKVVIKFLQVMMRHGKAL